MSTEQPPRLSYEDSCYSLGFKDTIPPFPKCRPKYDDEKLVGVRFFRTSVGIDRNTFENLTIPRTFIARSEIGPRSFINTDLSESTLCWNNFNGVNFADADLTWCDLRSSIFFEVSFVRTILKNADLRRSKFDSCDFKEADMQGTKLTRQQGVTLLLSTQQQAAIDWQDGDGDEPPGG